MYAFKTSVMGVLSVEFENFSIDCFINSDCISAFIFEFVLVIPFFELTLYVPSRLKLKITESFLRRTHFLKLGRFF